MTVRWVVATDLDGTLLDHETYSLEPARPALGLLRERRIPLVLVTSKTRAEAEGIAAATGCSPALVVENGGAVLLPGGRDVIELGVGYDALVAALAEIAREAGARVRGFSSLSRGDLEELTGLRGEDAERARRRGWDEPFLLSNPEALPALEEAAVRRGLSVTRGGRFHHLLGAGSDKGRALRVLLDRKGWLAPGTLCIGLGDAANDLPFLRIVDRPVIVPRPGGAQDPDLAAALPHATVAPAPGPRGWNAAVLGILGEAAGAGRV